MIRCPRAHCGGSLLVDEYLLPDEELSCTLCPDRYERGTDGKFYRITPQVVITMDNFETESDD